MTGYYPPDGFDSRQRTKEGVELRGTAALRHALTTEILAEEFIGSRRRWRKYPAVAKIESGELTPESVDYPDAREVLDGWKVEMHYDNTANGRFVIQDASVHYQPVDVTDHPDDPREGEREIEGRNAVRRRGVQGAGYDLWSHGYHGHDRGVPPSLPIASWNVQTMRD